VICTNTSVAAIVFLVFFVSGLQYVAHVGVAMLKVMKYERGAIYPLA